MTDHPASTSEPTDAELQTHLIALEQSLHSSATRNNPTATASLLSAHFREFGASGHIWDRAAILAQLAGESPVSILSSDFHCQRLTPHLALLTYQAATPTRRTLRSSLWQREDGTWKILFHQGTVIPRNP